MELQFDPDGYPAHLLDPAGIRAASDDPIEREGMRRARNAAARAHLVLWVVDASEVDAASLAAAEHEPLAAGTRRWIVVNKIDLLDGAAKQSTRSAPSPR